MRRMRLESVLMMHEFLTIKDQDYTDEQYLKSSAEMFELFSDYQTIKNSLS